MYQRRSLLLGATALAATSTLPSLGLANNPGADNQGGIGLRTLGGGLHEILLTVVIVEVSRNFMRSLGVDFAPWMGGQNAHLYPVFNFLARSQASAPWATILTVLTALQLISLIASVNETRARTIMSKPNVATRSGAPVNTFLGEQTHYASAAPRFQGFNENGIILKVTPHITRNGNVAMDMALGAVEENDDPVTGDPLPGIPPIEVRRATTSVNMQFGQTLAIGGLLNLDRQDTSRLPFLGGLPFLDQLFRSGGEASAQRELMIFVTPQIIVPEER